jgi:hypothetical protein
VIIGSLCTFAALGLANQSLVAGLSGGAVLIINVFLSRFINKDDVLASDGAFFYRINILNSPSNNRFVASVRRGPCFRRYRAPFV